MKLKCIIIIFLLFNCLYSFSQLQTRKVVIVSDDNKQLYVVDGSIIIYNLDNLSIEKVYPAEKSRADVIDLRNNQLLYGSPNSFTVVDTKTDISKAYELKPTDSKIYDVFLAFNADNSKVFATWDGASLIQIIDLGTGKAMPESFSIPGMIITRMDVSPDRKTLVALGRNATKGGNFLMMWNTETMKLIKKISLDNTSYTLVFNKDGSALVVGLHYYGLKSQSKYKISWNGLLTTYPLCIQVYSVPDGKLIKEVPSEMDQIYAISFDCENPEIFYTSNKTYDLMSIDNKKHTFSKINGAPGAGTCHLTSYNGHLVATAGYETTIYDTKDLNKKQDLYYYTIRPFYFSSNGDKLTVADKSKASLMFGTCYHDGGDHVQWFVVNKDGLYDCSGDFDKNFKWIYFTQFKPKTKEKQLFSKLLKGNDYKGLTASLASLLKEQKIRGNKVKELFEYSGLDFEPYYDLFGMKRKEEVVVKEPTSQTTGDVWADACAAANAKMKKDGLSIVTEKSGNADGLTGSFNLSNSSVLRWYILGNNSDTKLEITTPKGSDQVSLSQDGSKPLYYSSGEVNAEAGSYSFRLSGGNKGYIIAGAKILSSDQDDARKMLTSQGYNIVFESTQYAKAHEPITADLAIGGDIAWVAFTDSKCAPLQVSVNDVNTGNSSTQNGLIVNTGSTFIDKAGGVVLKAVPVSCGSSTTFIIGVK